MKTMIFSGRTMREAMAQAKQRFGADIDILSSDQVGDEIQVKVVVPEASTGTRRRKAADRVSAGIKALADAPMKGERARRTGRGVETVADAEGPPEGGGAEAAGAVATEGASGTKAGRTTRASRSARGETGKSARAAGTRKAGKETRADTVMAAATEAGERAPGEDGPVSTLDFERQRRLKQGKAEPLGPAAEAGAVPTQASSLVQALVAAQGSRTVRPQGQVAVSDPARAGSASATGAGAPSARAPEAGATSGAWRMAGQALQPSPVGGTSEPSASPAVSGASGTPQGSAQGTEVGAGSRLSVVLGSARRMLGSGPGRWLGGRGATEPVSLQSGASAPGATAAAAPSMAVPQEAAVSHGFGQDAPMPLSSLLQPGESEWPSLSLQTEEDDEAAGGESEVLASSAGLAAVGASAGDGRSRERRLDGIGWFEAARRRPAQMRLLRNLLSCQFSPALSRTLVSLLPVDYSDVQADEWLRQMMLRALAGVNGRAGILPGHAEQTIFDRGGVFALIGPTGVGKTTSIAKIAAHHVLRHGPKSLALITADVYRIGAQEQLRAFGKMLGVPVQVAQDREVLQTLLKEHEDRSLVLIDTAGISQRDERVSQLTSALSVAQVRRVLVLNAGTQPGGIEDVLRAFGASETAGVLLSKVDEAVGLGACFDALIRHRLPLVGYTDGQRVPEDYHPANLGQLIESALSGEATNRYPSLSMTDGEIRHLFEGAHV